jgi:hypothetical protein
MKTAGTYIPRKVYEPGGLAYLVTDGKCKPLAPHVAALNHLYTGKFEEITWAEIIEQRRKEQADRLSCIRQCAEPNILPCYVWTFFNEQDIPYHGWYCYVVTRHFEIGVNFRGFKEELAASIMQEILLGPKVFYEWMKEFADRYPRNKPSGDPRKSGSRVGWLSNKTTFTLARPDSSPVTGHSSL